MWKLKIDALSLLHTHCMYTYSDTGGCVFPASKCPFISLRCRPTLYLVLDYIASIFGRGRAKKKWLSSLFHYVWVCAMHARYYCPVFLLTIHFLAEECESRTKMNKTPYLFIKRPNEHENTSVVILTTTSCFIILSLTVHTLSHFFSTSLLFWERK